MTDSNHQEHGGDYPAYLDHGGKLSRDEWEAAGYPENDTKPPFDVVGFVMAYEDGELNDEQVIDGFQHLVNQGMHLVLQGSYYRTATALIDAGLVRA